MAYVTGSVNSLADLVTALQQACTANGWILAGNVLHKGACYASLVADATTITLIGGTGVDGNNALIEPSTPCYFLAPTTDPFTWPMTYHAFVGATEVYLVGNFSLTAYPWLCFGSSPLPGVGGTGNWVSSVNNSHGPKTSVTKQLYWDSCYGYSGYDLQPCIMSSDLFGAGSNFLHVDIDGTGAQWVIGSAQKYTNYLCAYQPNAWNGETALMPIQAALVRPSSKISWVLNALSDARYVRIDNITPGDVVMLGSEKWMVFPWWRKNAAARDGFHGGSGGANDTGTFGHAFRYDGP